MLATANRVTLNNVSGKKQAMLINCTQQVCEAILFGMKDLEGENREGQAEEKKESYCLQSGLLMGTDSLNSSGAIRVI